MLPGAMGTWMVLSRICDCITLAQYSISLFARVNESNKLLAHRLYNIIWIKIEPGCCNGNPKDKEARMYLTAEGRGCAMHQPSPGLGFSNTAAWRGLNGYYVMKKYILGKVPLTCGSKGSLNDGHHSQTFIGQGEYVGRWPVQDCVPT